VSPEGKKLVAALGENYLNTHMQLLYEYTNTHVHIKVSPEEKRLVAALGEHYAHIHTYICCVYTYINIYI